jgi:predicted amidohydrolase YtcJ
MPHQEIVAADAILTMDPRHPVVRALWVQDGRIRAAGEPEELLRLAGPSARRREWTGSTIVPGLIESHMHPVSTAMTSMWADCRSPGCADIGDILVALRERLASTSGWIRGWGYDDSLLADRRHLTRADLDAVSTDRPIVVTHISGHFAAANSVALGIAGVSEETVDRLDDGYPRDESGRLTGLLREVGPVLRVLDHVPGPEPALVARALRDTLAAAAARGATTIHDLAMTRPMLELYHRLEDSGDLPVAVVGYLRGDLLVQGEADGSVFRGEPGRRFRLAGAKFWADGSIQGLTAALREPYHCCERTTGSEAASAHAGDLLQSEEELREMCAAAARLGAQVAVHANGDRAVETALSVLGPLQDPSGGPHRIEHCQVVSARTLEGIRTAGLGVSFFVNHVHHWGDRHRALFLGEDRAANLDPLADADRVGLRFGLHSDSPVTPVDPVRTLWTAVARHTSSGEVLGGHQRVTAARAVQAMTRDSAWLTGDDGRKGSLSAGMAADLAVIEGDVLRPGADALKAARVAGVMVDGTWLDER